MPRLWPDRRSRLHAVVLDSPNNTVATVRRLRASGYVVADVQTPFPIHGLEEACGLRETRLPRATLLGGVLGLLLATGFQAWVSLVSWPLNIGGKSNLALPALAPVSFEVTVLFAAFASVGALIWYSGLRPGGRSPDQVIAESTDDRFVIVVAEGDATFDVERFRSLVGDSGALEVIEGWRVP